MFSAYAEGSGMNKYLQIYNPTSETIDLSAYTIHMESYGSKNNNRSASSDGKLQLSGTLAPGAVLVFRHQKAPAITASDIIDSKVCNFNGNDPIGLLKNGTVIDVIGPYGKGTTTNFATDKTLNTMNQIGKFCLRTIPQSSVKDR